MENSDDLTPEKITQRLAPYDKEFSITFEGDRAVSDITDIIREITQSLDPLIERFGSRAEIVRKDADYVDNFIRSLLKNELGTIRETFQHATVRVGESMMAVKIVDDANGALLERYQTDEDVVIEGYMQSIYFSPLHPRPTFEQYLQNPSFFMLRTDANETELHMCMNLYGAKIIEREERGTIAELGDVIIPLYPDALEMYRIDELQSDA